MSGSKSLRAALRLPPDPAAKMNDCGMGKASQSNSLSGFGALFDEETRDWHKAVDRISRAIAIALTHVAT
ncbi:hypothetical protein ACQ4M4_06725 [Leptolyngbya sp. AN02str]|uniref:hypothetical protein n=1 Tax=Leptolyngbya sp. AN02str TaxID=3423363 RepID=UPI003D315BE8